MGEVGGTIQTKIYPDVGAFNRGSEREKRSQERSTKRVGADSRWRKTASSPAPFAVTIDPPFRRHYPAASLPKRRPAQTTRIGFKEARSATLPDGASAEIWRVTSALNQIWRATSGTRPWYAEFRFERPSRAKFRSGQKRCTSQPIPCPSLYNRYRAAAATMIRKPQGDGSGGGLSSSGKNGSLICGSGLWLRIGSASR